MISSQDMGFPCIACGRKSFPSALTSYTYMEQVYQILPVRAGTVGEIGSNPLPDVILLAWDARYIEQGLRLLSCITDHSQVKDHSIPVVFCLTSCCQLKPLGISIDFQLLEDVLQIPVIPCSSPASAADDVKAAIAYAGKRRFSYYCLDFSPKKLTDETVRFGKNCLLWEKRLFFSGKRSLPLNRRVSGKGFSHPVWETMVFLSCLFALFYPVFALTLLFSQNLLNASLEAEALIFPALLAVHLPPWLSDCLACGVFRALACVISVMLPPLALSLPLIFFLEESGLLSRLSFLGDPFMAKCGGCGSQCLTMAMGAHCHLAGLSGCSLQDEKKGRLSAHLANILLPCGGRVPALLILFSLIVNLEGGKAAGSISALNPFSAKAVFLVPPLFLPGFLAALACLFLLSRAAPGERPSFFILELLPLRFPRVKPVILSAWSHACVFLGKAGIAAVFAGLLIWFLGHIVVNEASLLTRFTLFLDPFARRLGLDGVILAAFLLGSPANELTWPLILLLYLSRESHTAAFFCQPPALSSARGLAALLSANGWSRGTAVSAFLLTLFHWPCLPVLNAIRRETGSARLAAAAALIPAALGISLCFLANMIYPWLRLPGL